LLDDRRIRIRTSHKWIRIQESQHWLRRTSWWCHIPEVTVAGLSALDDVTRQELRKIALPLIMRGSLVWLDSGPLRRNLGEKKKNTLLFSILCVL
jgi:hypothetical protein